MGGGLMQLVAYGAQDVYLTGNPQITFFKVVYRRHTNFSIEQDELPIDTAKPSGTFTVPVLRNADLASKMYIKLQTPTLDSNFTGGNCKVAWVNRLGHAMIGYVKIQIGGTDIDKHVGVWLDIWYELTHTTDQERGYSRMIGDVPEMTTLSTTIDAYDLYIPLQFWFNRNPGLALPLIALQYHDVRLYVELEDINKLIVWSGTAPPLFSSIQSYNKASILVDYIYLDSEERRRFAQVGHEYLIEQVQYPGEDSINATMGTQVTDKTKLNFNHPCKEIIWALKVGAFNGEGNKFGTNSRGRFLAYTSATDSASWDSAIDYAAANLARGTFVGYSSSITGSNIGTVTTPSAVATGESTFFSATATTSTGNTVNLTVTLINSTASTIASSASVLSYVTNPLMLGSYNLLDELSTNVSGSGLQGSATSLVHLTVTATTVSSATVFTVGSNVVVTGHNLTLTDISVPLGDWTDSRFAVAKALDVNVIQPNNYGLRLDGSGNPVAFGNIQLNGHDRFDIINGSYFNYVQPYQCHTRTPADGVNLYSFGLHPEQHQPSGTANLSRIDTTILNITYSDPFRANKNLPALNFIQDTKFYVFATNYNVLRIMSGMAGLAYSN
jgi:hypothetical protein